MVPPAANVNELLAEKNIEFTIELKFFLMTFSFEPRFDFGEQSLCCVSPLQLSSVL